METIEEGDVTMVILLRMVILLWKPSRQTSEEIFEYEKTHFTFLAVTDSHVLVKRSVFGRDCCLSLLRFRHLCRVTVTTTVSACTTEEVEWCTEQPFNQDTHYM